MAAVHPVLVAGGGWGLTCWDRRMDRQMDVHSSWAQVQITQISEHSWWGFCGSEVLAVSPGKTLRFPAPCFMHAGTQTHSFLSPSPSDTAGSEHTRQCSSKPSAQHLQHVLLSASCALRGFRKEKSNQQSPP